MAPGLVVQDHFYLEDPCRQDPDAVAGEGEELQVGEGGQGGEGGQRVAGQVQAGQEEQGGQGLHSGSSCKCDSVILYLDRDSDQLVATEAQGGQLVLTEGIRGGQVREQVTSSPWKALVLRLASCPEETTRPSMAWSWKILAGSLVRSLAERSSRATCWEAGREETWQGGR